MTAIMNISLFLNFKQRRIVIHMVQLAMKIHISSSVSDRLRLSLAHHISF
jgi:hypothetical protein